MRLVTQTDMEWQFTKAGSVVFPIIGCVLAMGIALAMPALTPATPAGEPPASAQTQTPIPTGSSSCPPIAINGSIDNGDPTQRDRLYRLGSVGRCGGHSTCPGGYDGLFHHYDSYTFANTTGSAQCVTVVVSTGCTGNNYIFTAAYLGTFNPNNICTNYIGDEGLSPAPQNQFSFDLDSGQSVVVVVTEVNSNGGCPSYTLKVTGLCGGTTPTPSPTPTPTASPGIPLSIAGHVDYCSNPGLPAVPGVTMTVSGSASGSALSDGSGDYVLSSLAPGGTYTVTPTKIGLIPRTAGIDTVDALATQGHYLNIVTIPPGCGLEAADVNGDNRVDSYDVVAIQRFFIGRTFGTANVGQYRFSPPDRNYPGLSENQTAQDYDALILGDVTSPFAEP